jgi:hypothetical protein
MVRAHFPFLWVPGGDVVFFDFWIFYFFYFCGCRAAQMKLMCRS